MKTIQELKIRFSEIHLESTEPFDKSLTEGQRTRLYNKRQNEAKLIKTLILLLESNPSQESLKKSLKEAEGVNKRILDRLIAAQPKVQSQIIMRQFKKEPGVSDRETQIKNLKYLLK